MRSLGMRIVSGVLSFCLLMLLYGCNDSYASTYGDFPIDTTDGIPVFMDTWPSGEGSTASTDSAETTQPTETEPTQGGPTEPEYRYAGTELARTG